MGSKPYPRGYGLLPIQALAPQGIITRGLRKCSVATFTTRSCGNALVHFHMTFSEIRSTLPLAGSGSDQGVPSTRLRVLKF
jgi:hypothetical protein